MATNNRVGIESTQPSQRILELATRGTAANARATNDLRTVGGTATGNVRRTNENDPQNVVGTGQGTAQAKPATGTGTQGTANGGGVAAVHLRTATEATGKPNEQRAVAEAATGKAREDYQNDINANPTLVGALAIANLHPSADGLVRVDQAIGKNSAAWGAVVEAGNAVVATGGKSEAAKAVLKSAMQDFAKKAGLRTTDTADLAYMLARVMMKTDETERDDSMKRLQAALSAAEARLDKLKQDRTAKENEQTAPVQQQGGGGGKKDDGGNQSSNAAAVADQVAQKNIELAQIDRQMESTKDLINDLKAQMAAQGGGAGAGGGSNNDLINEAILAMVEQAVAMSALTQNTAPDEKKTQGGTGTGNGNGGTGTGTGTN